MVKILTITLIDHHSAHTTSRLRHKLLRLGIQMDHRPTRNTPRDGMEPEAMALQRHRHNHPQMRGDATTTRAASGPRTTVSNQVTGRQTGTRTALRIMRRMLKEAISLEVGQASMARQPPPAAVRRGGATRIRLPRLRQTTATGAMDRMDRHIPQKAVM